MTRAGILDEGLSKRRIPDRHSNYWNLTARTFGIILAHSYLHGLAPGYSSNWRNPGAASTNKLRVLASVNSQFVQFRLTLTSTIPSRLIQRKRLHLFVHTSS